MPQLTKSAHQITNKRTTTASQQAAAAATTRITSTTTTTTRSDKDMKRKQQLLCPEWMCVCVGIIVISVETGIACRFVGNSCAFGQAISVCSFGSAHLQFMYPLAYKDRECLVYGQVSPQLRARPDPTRPDQASTTPLIVSYLRFCTDYAPLICICMPK